MKSTRKFPLMCKISAKVQQFCFPEKSLPDFPRSPFCTASNYFLEKDGMDFYLPWKQLMQVMKYSIDLITFSFRRRAKNAISSDPPLPPPTPTSPSAANPFPTTPPGSPCALFRACRRLRSRAKTRDSEDAFSFPPLGPHGDNRPMMQTRASAEGGRGANSRREGDAARGEKASSSLPSHPLAGGGVIDGRRVGERRRHRRCM